MKAYSIYTWAALLTLFSSCDGPKSYIRTQPFVSCTDSLGQSELAGTFGFNRFEGMASYSPVQHLDIRSQLFLGSIGEAYELSFGLYNRMNRTRLACYAGIGRGNMKETKKNGRKHGSGNDDPDQHVIGSFNKIFIQPELGLITSEGNQFGLSGRLSYVQYDHLLYAQTSFSGTTPSYNFVAYDGRPKGLVVEGQMYIRRNLGQYFFGLNIGAAVDNFKDEYPIYGQIILSGNLGIHLDYFLTKPRQVVVLE